MNRESYSSNSKFLNQSPPKRDKGVNLKGLRQSPFGANREETKQRIENDRLAYERQIKQNTMKRIGTKIIYMWVFAILGITIYLAILLKIRPENNTSIEGLESERMKADSEINIDDQAEAVLLSNQQIVLLGEHYKQDTNVFITTSFMNRGLYIRHCHQSLGRKLSIQIYGHSNMLLQGGRLYRSFINESEFNKGKREQLFKNRRGGGGRGRGRKGGRGES